MPRRFLTLSVLVSAALFLTACEVVQPAKVDILTDNKFNPFQPHSLRLVAGGSEGMGSPPKPVNDFGSADEFLNTLKEFDPDACKNAASLDDCLTEIDRLDDEIEPLRTNSPFVGFSGIAGRNFLKAAKDSLNGNKVFKGVTVDVSGQITEKCLHDQNLDGYHYDSRRKFARICVVVTTETTRKGGYGRTKVEHEYFHVEADWAMTEARDNAHPDNVFPVAAMKTKLKVKATTAKDLQYKLYAWGKNIRVLDYWTGKKKDGNGNIIWDHKYNSSTPPFPKKIREIFEADPDACIDMMFLDPVPATLPSNYVGGINYCLGRCSNPAIVNTR